MSVRSPHKFLFFEAGPFKKKAGLSAAIYVADSVYHCYGLRQTVHSVHFLASACDVLRI
jgi:hypothetical protein